jgi:hypothetical protein
VCWIIKEGKYFMRDLGQAVHEDEVLENMGRVFLAQNPTSHPRRIGSWVSILNKIKHTMKLDD